MPIYKFECPTCKDVEEVILPIAAMNAERKCYCGTRMKRLMTATRSVIKKTGNGMALEALNSKDTSYMKPEHKRMAAQGLRQKEKVVW